MAKERHHVSLYTENSKRFLKIRNPYDENFFDFSCKLLLDTVPYDQDLGTIKSDDMSHWTVSSFCDFDSIDRGTSWMYPLRV